VRHNDHKSFFSHRKGQSKDIAYIVGVMADCPDGRRHKSRHASKGEAKSSFNFDLFSKQYSKESFNH